MARRSEPWTARLLNLVRLEPRPLDWLLEEAQSAVPPGRAYREAVKHRAHVYRYKTGRTRSTRDDIDDEVLRMGARRIASQSFYHLRRNGRVIEFEQNGERWVRYGRDATPEREMGLRMAATVERTPEMNAKRAASLRAWWAARSDVERAEHAASIRAGHQRRKERLRADP